MVPIGKMDRESDEIPVTIQPQLKCEWRWLNTSALACQLREEEKMTLATAYTVTMAPGIKTEDGIGLRDQFEHRFYDRPP